MRNRGDKTDEITPGNRIILVDSEGNPFPQRGKGVDGRKLDPERKDIAPGTELRSIKSGRAEPVLHGGLSRWYADVPPGKYSLIVVCRDSEGDFSIVSNTISLNVEPSAD